jgi:hypothetical protein
MPCAYLLDRLAGDPGDRILAHRLTGRFHEGPWQDISQAGIPDRDQG